MELMPLTKDHGDPGMVRAIVGVDLLIRRGAGPNSGRRILVSVDLGGDEEPSAEKGTGKQL